MNHINYFVDYQYPNMSNTSSGNIVDTEVGFKRGNMFNSLYDEYKNYKLQKTDLCMIFKCMDLD